MECRYTYTAGEHGRALNANHRLKLTRLILMSIAIWVFFIFIVGDPDSIGSGIPIFIAVAFTFVLLIPPDDIRTRFAFRRNVHFNQPMVYVLAADGFTMRSPLMGQSASWAAIGRAGETNAGFLLFWGKSKNDFVWLPKTGFASQDEIITCRNLILMNVRLFKKVQIRRSIVARIAPRPVKGTLS